ncbi:hypothetical protein CFI11_20420 [Thalassococcus sp. S3]|nr:hypothetical protein CFI11_20420 [Thalassococcus sp. S3]
MRAWPSGTSEGQARGRRYHVSKSVFARGKSIKLVAHEIGGTDYISLNLYDLSAGPRLFPCEMPMEKVLAFLTDLEKA